MQRYLFLFSLFIGNFFIPDVFAAFRETPASYLGEINSRVTLTCAFYQEMGRLNEPIRIEIEWLFAKPRIAPTSSNIAPEFKPFYEDRRRIFVTYARSEADRIVTNSSTIEIRNAMYEDMGKYKCIINKGSTYGGFESPIAEIRLVPRMSVDPKIAQIDRDKERVGLFCNVSWLDWDRSSGMNNIPLDLQKTGCKETKIEWYASRENMWVNPNDPAAMESAFNNRRPATQIPNVVVENSGRRLWIYSEPEGSNYYWDKRNRQRRIEEDFFFGQGDDVITRLDRDLIKITGIFWCEFQYCYEKDMQTQRTHAVVKYPIKFEREKMERSLKGFTDEDMEIPCVVAGGPYYTIKWGKGNKTLSGNRNEPRSTNRNDELRYYDFKYNKTTGQPDTLVLRGLEHFDRAEYFCNATSFDGTEISASFMLKVKDQYTSYIPLGVIVAQILLIFMLIFVAEKFFVQDPHQLHKHNERFSVVNALEMTHGGSRRNLTVDDRTLSVARGDFVDIQQNAYNSRNSVI